MRKTIVVILAAAMFLAAAVAEVSAQEVLMNSAETINQGNIKLALFPTVLFGKNGSNSLWGVAGRAGYGLTPRFDIEVKGAIFKGLKYFGVDVEYWLIKGRKFNVSVGVGGHLTDVQVGADSWGIDTALLISTSPVRNLELYGGLKCAFDSFKNSDQKATLVYLVPGIEYRITDDLDFLAEFGIALNHNSRHYASVGLALYLLR
jgi:opacity protein-like surface antigen